MSSIIGNASKSYSGGVEATAVAALKTQFYTYLSTNAETGAKVLDRTALVAWILDDFKLLTTDNAGGISTRAAAAVDVFANSLAPAALGYYSTNVNGTAVTAAAVASKKAEVEALGKAVDDHFSTMSGSAGAGVLDEAVKRYMAETDLSGQFPEVVRRIVDPRFYVQTWVTAWGEESAPSLPSVMVEPDQNDVVIVRPASATNSPDVTVPPADLGVIGWRLYRSNSGNTSSGFQLVPDLALVAEKEPLGSPEDVIRATYKELNRSGILGVTDFEVLWWLDYAVAQSKVAKTGTTLIPIYDWPTVSDQKANATWLRQAMVNAATNDSDSTEAIARVLAGDYSLKLPDGSYNCFKLALGEYPDAVRSSQLAEALASTAWLPPPEDLRGMTGMANGIMAGFFGNAVCFSEAYTPHAWPVEYQITVDYPVVAVAAFGQTLFVGTQGSVYLMSGSDPSSMSSQVMPGGQSCSSARSVVAVDNGVLFVSPEGICLADLSGVKVLTTGLFTRSGPGGWTAMNPSTMIAAMHDGVYYLLYDRVTGTLGTTASQVIAQTYADIQHTPTTADTTYWAGAFTAAGWSLSQLRQTMLVEAAANATDPGYAESARLASVLLLENSQMGCYALDMVSGKLTQVDVFGTAFHRDVATDKLYVAHGTKIRDLFSASTTRTSAYRTGIIQTPKQSPFAWLQVDGDFTDPVVVKWYGDGVLRHTKTLTALEPVRLPPGRYREHEVEVISTGRVTSVTLAGTTEELQNV